MHYVCGHGVRGLSCRPTTTNLGMGTSKVNRCKTIEILDDHVVIDGGRVTYNQVSVCI